MLFGVSVLVFFATQALPGDPAVQILGQTATPEQLTALRNSSASTSRCSTSTSPGSGNLLTGSLGESLTSPQSVGSLLVDRGLASLALVGASAIAIPLAVLLGSVVRGAARSRVRPRRAGHLPRPHRMPEFVIGLGLLILLGTTVFTVLPPVA